jgi:hypothetical protein
MVLPSFLTHSDSSKHVKRDKAASEQECGCRESKREQIKIGFDSNKTRKSAVSMLSE